MKNFFLTLDFEEWYHLEYFKDIRKNQNFDHFVFRLDKFFDFLKNNNIKITVFVVAELALKYPEIIQKISNHGHEIACHGLDHNLVYEKSSKDFRNELIEAKKILEKIIDKPVYGYRAPCFSMMDERFNILKELNFKYDSSYIKFSQHKLYRNLKLEGFNKVDDLIYEKNKFYEFEVPTLNLFNLIQLPISGGGYFRILPYFIFDILFRNYSEKHKNFNFYIHPFELDDSVIKINNTSFINKLRFNFGRKNNLEKLKKFIVSLKNNYKFSRLIDTL
jgi:polysaccharide deacetylase family protein (PEP-CTERM system associated)